MRRFRDNDKSRATNHTPKDAEVGDAFSMCANRVFPDMPFNHELGPRSTERRAR